MSGKLPLTILNRYHLFVSLLLTVIAAQGQRVISGTVSDKVTGKPLAYSTLGLKKTLVGVVSNENGQFEFHLPAEAGNDTLMVNAFGYKRLLLPLNQAHTPLNLRLQENVMEIEEVKIKPQPPEFYVREAVRRISANYPSSPFETVGYYREKVIENKNFLKCDEAVFKTYCPNYLDTVRSQDQVYLYRQVAESQEMQFMSRELAREKEKEEKEKKRQEKKKQKGKVVKADTTKQKKGIDIDLGSGSFSGPENILKSSRMGTRFWMFLDTTKIEDYKYAFAGRSFFNDRELMVISFNSRGKVDHVRETGRLYMDDQNFAVVKIENSGDLVVPVLIRPIIFMYGLGVTNPEFTRSVEFREVSGRWYPQKIQFHVEARLTKRYWFEPNDKSLFEIDQIFTVNKIGVENPLPVPLSKRYKPGKKMEEQIYNDAGLEWDQINVILR